MAANHLVSCIYCGTPVDPTKGEGDHVIPAALGHFKNELLFKRICAGCNTLVSRAEEQLTRCGPEAFLRILLNPVMGSGRKHRGKGGLGSQGKPPPKSRIQHQDHEEVVDLIAGSKGLVESPEQFIFTDKDKKQHTFKLFPTLTGASFKKKVQGIRTLPEHQHYLHCDMRNVERYLSIFREAWPTLKFESLPTLPVGNHRVAVSTTLVLGHDYWRAIAKIAFHYYLVNSRRWQGDEPCFAPIRKFICEGGDKTQFFQEPVKFQTTFGMTQLGFTSMPRQWMHVLAAEETKNTAIAAVNLFLGPEFVPPSYQLNLGNFRSLITTTKQFFSHFYVYNDDPQSGSFAGDAFPTSLFWQQLHQR